jgi:hypothetical protein
MFQVTTITDYVTYASKVFAVDVEPAGALAGDVGADYGQVVEGDITTTLDLDSVLVLVWIVIALAHYAAWADVKIMSTALNLNAVAAARVNCYVKAKRTGTA